MTTRLVTRVPDPKAPAPPLDNGPILEFQRDLRQIADRAALLTRTGRRRYAVRDCWYSVKPMALQTAATIQNRRMIFVSDHALSSK